MTGTNKPVLLLEPVLGLGLVETSEDLEAERLLRELIANAGLAVSVTIDRRELGSGNPPTPWVRTRRSFWPDLRAIQGLVHQESALH